MLVFLFLFGAKVATCKNFDHRAEKKASNTERHGLLFEITPNCLIGCTINQEQFFSENVISIKIADVGCFSWVLKLVETLAFYVNSDIGINFDFVTAFGRWVIILHIICCLLLLIVYIYDGPIGGRNGTCWS